MTAVKGNSNAGIVREKHFMCKREVAPYFER